MVEPAARDNRVPVQMRDVIRREEGGEDVAYEAADAVDGEDVQRVVAAQEVLELGGVVARDAAADAEDDGCPCGHVAGARRDGDEARDDAGAEADGGPFALEAVVDETPGDAADTGGEVGAHCGHDGAEVG